MEHSDTSEVERIRRLRESDITKDLHKFDEAFRTSSEAGKKEQTSNETPAWATFLIENPINTREQLGDFRERFPDAKGEVIMMQILRLAGKLGL